MIDNPENWFSATPLGDGITHIIESPVAPLLQCNIWHVRGRDRDLLIDTGLGLFDLQTAFADLFARPVTVVLTHAHRDHSGGAHSFADVRIHECERHWAESAHDQLPLDIAEWPDGLADWFAARGYACGRSLFDIPVAQDRLRRGLEKIRVSAGLVEGDVIDLGNRAFEILHLPGHSPGSIGLLNRSTGQFFSGDAIYDGPLLDDLEESNRADCAATMRRLASIEVTQVLPGHGARFGQQQLRTLASTWLKKAEGQYQ
jgi:glyoxylase-like metal-dependent hydrolase (beta-lactamase superfamily II)